jgi:hypothetical protein
MAARKRRLPKNPKDKRPLRVEEDGSFVVTPGYHFDPEGMFIRPTRRKKK